VRQPSTPSMRVTARWSVHSGACRPIAARRSLRDVRHPSSANSCGRVKSWWGVQGVHSQTKGQMAEALLRLDWSAATFDDQADVPKLPRSYASNLVEALVAGSQALGAPRREFSLASKVLHWLLPWRVPVYDAFVCRALRVPTSWDAADSYRRVVSEIYSAIPDVAAADRTWMGSVEPRSPLRAIDKWLWWVGGGNAEHAVVVKDPWRTVRRLGLDPR
jgi:hypothetical protein